MFKFSHAGKKLNILVAMEVLSLPNLIILHCSQWVELEKATFGASWQRILQSGPGNASHRLLILSPFWN